MRRWAFGLLILIGLINGCQSNGGGHGEPTIGPSHLTAAEFREQAMELADSYVVASSQATDELCAATTRPDVISWARQRQIATGYTCYSFATGPNDVGCMLDLLAYTTLRADATENHWIPAYLHDEGKPMLQMERQQERSAWDFGSKLLSSDQLKALRGFVDKWELEHPNQYYIAYIRFADVAELDRYNTGESEAPSSLFALLYLDPMAGLDPVARELQGYRGIAERAIFLANRLPALIGMQVDERIERILRKPEIRQLLADTGQLTESSDRIVTLAEKYPGQISAEREAAIDQASAVMTNQREAILSGLDQREERLRDLVTDINRTLDRVQGTGLIVNQQTRQTLVATEDTGNRLVHVIFVDVLIVVLIIIGGVLTAIVLRHRYPGSPPSPPRVRSDGSP
jgi:hypothetical protein